MGCGVPCPSDRVMSLPEVLYPSITRTKDSGLSVVGSRWWWLSLRVPVLMVVIRTGDLPGDVSVHKLDVRVPDRDGPCGTIDCGDHRHV